MRITWEPLTLDLAVTFRVAHGASDQRHNVLVRIDDGLGEAAAVPYYHNTAESLGRWLADAAGYLGDDPLAVGAILDRLPADCPAALAAVDMALHDLLGKRLGRSLHDVLGLPATALPETSFTIGMDAPEIMAERAAVSGMPILKIKLGGDADLAAMTAVRLATTARLRVDANAGWERDQAAAIIPALAEMGVELVEQPLPAGDVEGLRWLRRQRLGAPIFGDEGVCTAADVAAHADALDGVVIKLAKCGGIRAAMDAMATARALGMRLMMSCMVESSLAVTAAAHLAPLCDYVDLDGPLLVRNDPFVGLRYECARIILPEGPGLGVQWRESGQATGSEAT
jgi:L-alanine-DL-glutamate epimerase-like enolase superfamily enzyme